MQKWLSLSAVYNTNKKKVLFCSSYRYLAKCQFYTLKAVNQASGIQSCQLVKFVSLSSTVAYSFISKSYLTPWLKLFWHLHGKQVKHWKQILLNVMWMFIWNEIPTTVKEIPHWFKEWLSHLSFYVLSCKECISLSAFSVLTKCLQWWDAVCGNAERQREAETVQGQI